MSLVKRLASTLLISAAALGALSPAWAEGTLKVALSSNLNTLDPAKTKIGDEYVVNFLVYSGLTTIDADGKLVPDLAESWTVSDDLKSWTFKLREGVKFHSGKDLEASDVKATIERIQNKETGSVARANFSIVTAITEVDKHTIKFDLSIPYAGFAELFADRQLRIVPADKLDKIATEPDGTGPFVFESFRPGQDVKLLKNENYYKDGQPKLDAIELRIMPEVAARVSAVSTGEVDLVWDMPPEGLQQIENNPDVTIDSVATSSWDGLILNNAHAPFDNPNVRQAISAGIDREAMVEFAVFGAGTPTLTMIPPGHPYHNDDIPLPKPDVDKAKQLLAEAGFPDGFEATLYVPSGRPPKERLGLAAREMLAQIGIKVDIQVVPWDSFISNIEGKAAFYVDGFYSRPAVDPSIFPWFHSTGSWNSTLWNYSNSEIDAVLDKARATTDEEERASLYKEFQRLAYENPPSVIPYVINHANAVRTNVKGFRSSPMMWLDLRETTVE
ncbi:peptide/nickel transport system substrate-binding protein [Mesorhizobium sp. J18]|uniref:ABC transporter substrate-binding protein n=1 Tax=Mesorhizobium sp. J18 TaxID=935263 RepID=UPI00119C48E1|nr:ABC transporter substrate-binding protein [Mesorhizobium sp. J18]TWG94240.1 peptide/nickel transport system substrate-binding protein [Mesorhizobium sp. J18]